MDDNKKLNGLKIGLIAFPLKNPIEECGQMYTSEFVNVLAPLSSRLYIITGNYFPNDIPNNVRIINIKSPIIKTHEESIISKFHRFLVMQFRISMKLILLSKQIDIIILYFGASLIWLPTLIARIQRKKILTVVTGSGSQSIERMYLGVLGKFFSSIFRLIEHLNFILSDKIVVFSDRMVGTVGINRYRAKVITDGCPAYINTDRFRVAKSLDERKNIIGYVGRLSGEKGVIELTNAIPIILSKRNDVKFIIVGDGVLMNKMKDELNKTGCLEKVEFTGLIDHERIPDYLNDMKFHILPSHTEAFGGANLESMACGAIVIANSVGGVPDIVTNNETGFLLKDNSPQSIANKVIELLGSPELERIQKNARDFVERKWRYESAVERYRQIFKSLIKKERGNHE